MTSTCTTDQIRGTTAPTVDIRRVTDKRMLEAFLRVPWSLGMNLDPNWVPPLLDEYRRLLDPRRSPFLKHGAVQCFIAYRGERPVGRISAQVDFDYDRQWPREPLVASFGFFESEDDRGTAAALLSTAEAWARDRERTTLRGPFTLDSKGEAGVLVDGFSAPRIGTPYNKPYLGPLLESVGYTRAKDLYCWWCKSNDVDPLTKKLADRTRALPNVRVRTMKRKHMQKEVDIVRDIYNEAWKNNWGFVPFTSDELRSVADDYKLFLDEEIALVAEVDGEPAAICFAVPDLNELIRDFDGELMRRPLNLIKLLWRLKFSPPKAGRLILLGVREKYRASRKYGALVAVLYAEIARRGGLRGYEGGELGWTIEDNHMINTGIERMGAKKCKTYRVYERALG